MVGGEKTFLSKSACVNIFLKDRVIQTSREIFEEFSKELEDLKHPVSFVR